MITVNQKKQRGFIIIEALVVASLLGFGFAASNKAQVSMFKSRQSVNEGSLATQLQAQQMEQLKDYSSIAAYNNIASSSNSTTTVNTTLNQTLTVTNQTNYKQLDYTIGWVDGNNQNQSIALRSYISQNDPSLSGALFNSNYATTAMPTPGSSSSSSSTGSSSSSTGSSSSSTGSSSSSTGSSSSSTDSSSSSSSSGQQTLIDLSGAITTSTSSSLKPTTMNGSLSTIALQVTTSNLATATCTYKTSGAFSCVLGRTWSGSITLTGISTVTVCTTNSQPYTNLTTSLTSQNYLLIKYNKTCPSTYPYTLQNIP